MIYPNLAGINYESIVDGPGIRIAIFLSGCTNNCKGCHNRDAQNPCYGIPITDSFIRHLCDIIQKRKYISGITLTGGDPFFWPENTINLMLSIKEELKSRNVAMPSVWIYTGYSYENLFEDKISFQLLKLGDVLVDGRFEERLADKQLMFRGSTNQRIIDLKSTIDSNNLVLWNDGEYI